METASNAEAKDIAWGTVRSSTQFQMEFTNSSFHLRTTNLYLFNRNTPNPGVTFLQGQFTVLNQQHAPSHLQDTKKEMNLLSTSLSFILKDTTSKSIHLPPSTGKNPL
jgi:hypothetical protein